MFVSRTRLSGAVALLLLAGGLSACNADDVPGASAVNDGESSSAEPTPEVPPFKVTSSLGRAATDVPLDADVSVTATGGTITSVAATSAAGKVEGEVAPDGATWRATGRLEPGTTYLLTTTGKDQAGEQVTRKVKFSTQDLTLDEQTYPSVAPLAGETVGVGMPVIVSFDVPVTDKAAFETHMKVTATPAQPGSWHWLSDNEAHWRPKTYWQAGTDVHVDVDVNSIPAGNGVYGQESRELDFHIGDANIYKVNAQTHQMKVFSNGRLLRTIPITTGEQPAFTTRSGVKVIIEKFDEKRMNSETVGIGRDNPEFYDIDDVKWAMRVTYSGEFIHAAPWSVASQGNANVSHGCTGLSTENAGWLYAMSRRGDVVEYTGTDKPMTLDNGYGDWNASYAEYRQGSALS
ncbi:MULTISPECIES: L,D-transpeptidase [unclassified Nocardioides]|uniref:L,D-transpeptidase n=1 Tax=unclassified Nocardioides TaxID=2615069 RepID=UPI003621D9C2